MVTDTRRCIYKSLVTTPSRILCTLLHRTAGTAYARRVALTHAILVSLCEQAGSGYELARRFDRSIGYFWAATHQQIYRSLRAMDDDGWVHVQVVAQHGRPDKKVYDVTDRGRAELTRWIAEPLTAHATRDLAVKLRGSTFGDAATPAALREQVVALRAERAGALDVYRGFEKSQFPHPAELAGAALHQYLVLRGGIRTEEGTIDWLDEVLAALGGTHD